MRLDDPAEPVHASLQRPRTFGLAKARRKGIAIDDLGTQDAAIRR
jgi:hypothetical protein